MIFWVHGRIKGQKTVQNDKKLCLLSNKKLSGNIIILHMCTINNNHMIYGSWAMEHDRQIFLSFWITFCPFTPLPSPSPKNPKNQHFEEMKKTPAEIMILHKCTKNHDHMLHCPWDTMHDGCNSYFLFWAIFSTTPKIKTF